MVLYPNKLPESERVCSGICTSDSNSNISLMYELWQGRVIYGSLWEVEGGSIEISIEKSSEGINEGIVVIKYRDSQNIETKIQKDLEDI